MSEPLWTSAAIAAATGGRLDGAPFAATGMTFDSREVAPGDLFVALAGARDGHDFIPAALASGAVGVLAARPVEGGSAVVVGDTLHGLEALAVVARERSPARRAAVTGSVGKTSVTQAIAAALRLAGPAHGSVKSFNNHIGVPLTLARMPAGTERAVFEIGMNHAGEIGPLSRLVAPHVAVVTNVGPVHTENFPDGEAGVARAKAEVFEGLAPGGVAVIPSDSPWTDVLREAAERAGARVLTFGEGGDAHLLSSPSMGEAGFRAVVHGREIDIHVAQAGAHWGPNGVAVLLACGELGVPVETTLQALAAFGPLAGRGRSAPSVSPGARSRWWMRATTPTPSPCGRRSTPFPAAPVAASPCSPTCWSWAPRPPASTLSSRGPRWPPRWRSPFPPARLCAPSTTRCRPPAEAAGPRPPRRSRRRLVDAVRPGDVVMVKGSNGSKALAIVAALIAAHAPVSSEAG